MCFLCPVVLLFFICMSDVGSHFTQSPLRIITICRDQGIQCSQLTFACSFVPQFFSSITGNDIFCPFPFQDFFIISFCCDFENLSVFFGEFCFFPDRKLFFFWILYHFVFHGFVFIQEKNASKAFIFPDSQSLICQFSYFFYGYASIVFQMKNTSLFISHHGWKFRSPGSVVTADPDGRCGTKSDLQMPDSQFFFQFFYHFLWKSAQLSSVIPHDCIGKQHQIAFSFLCFLREIFFIGKAFDPVTCHDLAFSITGGSGISQKDLPVKELSDPLS